MLNDVSKKINSKLLKEEAQADFLLAISEEEHISFLDRDVNGKKLNENGDEFTMSNGFYKEDTEFDPDLTTSLQDETDADDDTEFDGDSDLNDLTDLQDEVDILDDYSEEYTADTMPNSLLDKEDDYNDTRTTPVDLTDYIEESADIFDLLSEGGEDGTIPDSDDNSDINFDDEQSDDVIETPDWDDNDIFDDDFLDECGDDDMLGEAEDADTSADDTADDSADDDVKSEDFFVEGLDDVVDDEEEE